MFDDEDVSPFFGYTPMTKMPSGGSPHPVSPGFGMTGRVGSGTFPSHQLPRPRGSYAQPGNFYGDQRAAQSLRGSRATVLDPSGRPIFPVPKVPKGLLAGDDPPAERNDRLMPAPFIDDVDIDNNWFSPFQPVWPFGPPYVNYPREWDYPVGVNLDYQPRRIALYEMLRALARSWGVLATVKEARIDEMVALKWKFVKDDGKGGKTQDDPRIRELADFFRKPDRKHPYPMWMRMIFRDRYEIDAASVYIWRNRAMNKPYALEPLDGATVKPLVDDSGRIPDFPNPAYQQIIKGLPMNNYTERELVYMPARPRTDLPIYGYSEVEQIMMEATEGVRKTLYMLNFWKEGTIPDVMLGVPENWTPEQIMMWQASFDALLSGNIELKSKIRFIPGGMKPFEMKGSAGELLKSDYDEWITRIICFAFRVMPKPFIREPVSRANAESEKEQITEQGLQSEMMWYSALINELVRVGWGWTDIRHQWDQDEEIAATDQATVDTMYLKVGKATINELRARDGQDPIEGGDVAMVYTGSGATPLAVLAAQTEMPHAGGASGGDDDEESPSGKGAEKAVAGLPFSKRGHRWRKY
jgi:hypothetical protein